MDAFPITLYRAFVVISSRRLSRTVGQRTTERLSAYYFRRPSRTAGQRTTEHLSAYHPADLIKPHANVLPSICRHIILQTQSNRTPTYYRVFVRTSFLQTQSNRGPTYYRAFVGISLCRPNQIAGPAYYRALLPSICRYITAWTPSNLRPTYYRAFVGISSRRPKETAGLRYTEHLSVYRCVDPIEPQTHVLPSICRHIIPQAQGNRGPSLHRAFVGISSRRPQSSRWSSQCHDIAVASTPILAFIPTKAWRVESSLSIQVSRPRDFVAPLNAVTYTIGAEEYDRSAHCSL